MSKEAMKLALEALIRSRSAVSGDLDLAGCAYGSNDPDGHRYNDAKKALVTLDKAITSLREALAEQPAQQEPFAWMPKTWTERYASGVGALTCNLSPTAGWVPLYTSPPQRTWVGLTDCEREKLRSEADEADTGYRKLIKATEAKLKEKNT